MRISPINTLRPNIYLKGKTFTPKESVTNAIKHKSMIIEKDAPIDLETIQALNGFGLSTIKNLSVDGLAKYVEQSINRGLEEKLLEYHKTVLDAHELHWNESSFEFDDGLRKYSAMHNFKAQGKSFYTIQVSQDYKGIPYDSKVYYQGCPNGKLSNPGHQTGFIYPHTNKNQIEYVEYSFRDYNLDDEHGCTDAMISKDGTIKEISTGYDMLISPIKIQYNYENGILKNAHFRIFNNRYKGREAICTFDENRKVSQIFYPKKNRGNEILPEETYKRSDSGNFALVSREY